MQLYYSIKRKIQYSKMTSNKYKFIRVIMGLLPGLGYIAFYFKYLYLMRKALKGKCHYKSYGDYQKVPQFSCGNLSRGRSFASKEITFNDYSAHFPGFANYIAGKSLAQDRYILSFDWIADVLLINSYESELYIINSIKDWQENFRSFQELSDPNYGTYRLVNLIYAFNILKRNHENLDFILEEIYLHAHAVKYLNFNPNHKSVSRIVKALLVFRNFHGIDKDFNLEALLHLLYESVSSILLPDGSLKNGSVNDTLDVLKDLLEVNFIIKSRKLSNRVRIKTLIDKITVFLRSIRHNDWSFALDSQSYDIDKLFANKILSLSEMNSGASILLRHSGYCGLHFDNYSIIALNKKRENNRLLKDLMCFELSNNAGRIVCNNNGLLPQTSFDCVANNKLLDIGKYVKGTNLSVMNHFDNYSMNLDCYMNAGQTFLSRIINANNSSLCVKGQDFINYKQCKVNIDSIFSAFNINAEVSNFHYEDGVLKFHFFGKRFGIFSSGKMKFVKYKYGGNLSAPLEGTRVLIEHSIKSHSSDLSWEIKELN